MKTAHQQLGQLTWYFKDVTNTATVELLKDGNTTIGYIAYQIQSAEKMKEILIETGDEEFTLPNDSEFLYVEAFEILNPFQDRGYGKKAFQDFKEKHSGMIILQFTELSEYFWEKFNAEVVKGTHWWAFIEN